MDLIFHTRQYEPHIEAASIENTVQDSDLVHQAQSGDKEAFGELVRRYHTKVIGSCWNMLSNWTLAEDAAQEVFVKAYNGLGRFRHDARFSTWLYQITHRHCLDLLRKKAREKSESWEALLEEHGDRIHGMMANPGTGSDHAENRDLIERVLSHMTPEYRLALTLREVEGLRYDEIARAMGCSLDSVKARLRRARQEMAQKLRHFLTPETVKIDGDQS